MRAETILDPNIVADLRFIYFELLTLSNKSKLRKGESVYKNKLLARLKKIRTNFIGLDFQASLRELEKILSITSASERLNASDTVETGSVSEDADDDDTGVTEQVDTVTDFAAVTGIDEVEDTSDTVETGTVPGDETIPDESEDTGDTEQVEAVLDPGNEQFPDEDTSDTVDTGAVTERAEDTVPAVTVDSTISDIKVAVFSIAEEITRCLTVTGLEFSFSDDVRKYLEDLFGEDILERLKQFDRFLFVLVLFKLLGLKLTLVESSTDTDQDIRIYDALANDMLTKCRMEVGDDQIEPYMLRTKGSITVGRGNASISRDLIVYKLSKFLIDLNAAQCKLKTTQVAPIHYESRIVWGIDIDNLELIFNFSPRKSLSLSDVNFDFNKLSFKVPE